MTDTRFVLLIVIALARRLCFHRHGDTERLLAIIQEAEAHIERVPPVR